MSDSGGKDAVTSATGEETTPQFSYRVSGGRVMAPIGELSGWDENPRKVEDSDIGRLKEHIKSLGFYKPLVVTSDGTVIGGNMRLRALNELGHEEAWVSLVDPEDEDELLEYAMSDNDRVGYYEEDAVAELVNKYEVDVARFKVDFYQPTDLAQNLAAAMSPEELLGDDNAGQRGDGEESGVAGDAEGDGDAGDGDGDSSTPRSMEYLGDSSATVQVQLFMTQDEKAQFTDDVGVLKQAFDADTTTDVVKEAVSRQREELE